MSWAPDDSQLLSLCDGSGWEDGQSPTTYYNSRLYRVLGATPTIARFVDLPGYPDLINDWRTRDQFSRYYGFATLAINSFIYQFLSTLSVPVDQPGARFVGAKLIFSPDHGGTWCNQDGSAPVVWEAWEDRSRDNMLFFEEEQEAFQLLSVLQMGRGYADNRDGYVYVFSPNGNVEGTMNELVMFRVPTTRITERSAYEFFVSGGERGAVWTTDIDHRGVVLTFPRGWVNTRLHPYAWQPSVAYFRALDLYVMAAWGTGCADDGLWFGKPSYLGFWESPTPWGPWRQIHEEVAWTPLGDSGSRAYQPQIAPKWIAQDGQSFWLVWTDFQETPRASRRTPDERRATRLAQTPEEVVRDLAADRPYYRFNVQRVEVQLAGP